MSSSRLNIVFLDRATIPPWVRIKALSVPHELTLFETTSPEEVAPRIASADVVIANKVKLTAAALSTAERLKLISIAATGFDNIDLNACAARGVSVCNVRNYAIRSVPEHVFALIFTLRRSLAAYHQAVQNGRWAESGQFCFFDFPIRGLSQSTIGIIGDGALGKATAKIAEGLGLRVLFSAHKGRPCTASAHTPFEEVLQASDIITLHCPLNSETADMIGDAEFAQMTRKPILINTARGGIVNEPALVRALRSNQISGAGFDVVSQEPLPDDHPFTTILDHPGFILTPHIAWASEEAIQTLADQVIDNIEAYLRGSPENLVV